MSSLILVLGAYLCGSFPSGKVYGLKFKSIDIQAHGSGNIGFANACRVLGLKLGFAVLFSDVLKGFLPLITAKLWLGADTRVLLAMGLAAILGHAFPVWLKFKGGKSIATGLGILLVIAPVLAVAAVGVYILMFSVTRVSGISSVAGTWSLVAWSILLQPGLVAYCALLALFATYTHRSNIRQLVYKYAE